MLKITPILTLLALFATLTLVSDGRTFTDSRGRQIEAEIFQFNDGFVKLKYPNGSVTKWLPLNVFSESDQRYIREQGMTLSSTFQMTLREVVMHANQIDRFIQGQFRQHNIQQTPPSTDEQFIRRVYLDVLGRIPSYDEVTTFLDSQDPGKRRKTIDELLKHPGYVSNNYNYWADVLRLRTRERNGDGGAYIEWVKQAIRENKPYDLLVQELLTAEGYPWDNPAVGYYIRDDGTPLDNMSNTIQDFLGTQLVCAQCHNHPFEDWTQMEYYQMAAYTFGVETRLRPKNLEEARKLIRTSTNGNRNRAQSMNRAVRDLFEPITFGAMESKRSLKLPNNYKYEDAKP
ncbi:MAG: DUF1549 domain-containing protein, partial [Opitutae bacterium]